MISTLHCQSFAAKELIKKIEKWRLITTTLFNIIRKQLHKVKQQCAFVNPHMHKLGRRGPTHYIFGD